MGTTTESDPMKRALIYNPYFDTLGGGEKYTIGVMLALLAKNYEITVAWNDVGLSKKIFSRFGEHLSFTTDIAGYSVLKNKGIFDKYRYLSQYDFVFWVSDGSIPFLFGKHNVIHFQVPFSAKTKSLLTSWKWKSINGIVCNSGFTKSIIDNSYGVKSVVVYPPCRQIKSLAKENIILSVGRFDGLLHNKRQDVLIETFRQMKLNDWKLILLGGDTGQTDNLLRLKQLASGLPIQFVVNPDFNEVQQYLGHVSIYWHAAGFEINEQKEPEKVEHFGIATVEAMSAGAVPLVYQAGGQLEIVHQGENGYLWTTINELINDTRQIVTHPELLAKLSESAITTSKQFTMERFIHDFTNTCIS